MLRYTLIKYIKIIINLKLVKINIFRFHYIIKKIIRFIKNIVRH